MRSAVAACLVAAATVTLGLTAVPAEAAPHGADVLHVAPDGRGSHCAANDPCSLATARGRAEALVPHAAGDVVVELSGGTYRLTAPLRFGAQDSGRPGHPVVYRAAAGQSPVLSGATRVTGFSEVDPARHLYRAAVPAGTASRELFVNGVRAVRARSAKNPSGFSVTATGFTTGDPSYTSWTDPAQVEVVQDNAWKQMRCPLASITPSASGGSDLTVDPGCWKNNHSSVPDPSFPFNGAGLPGLNGISLAGERLPTAGHARPVLPRQRAPASSTTCRGPARTWPPRTSNCPPPPSCWTPPAHPATWPRSTTPTGGAVYTGQLGLLRAAGTSATSATTSTTPRPTATRSATPSAAPASRSCPRRARTRAARTSTSTAEGLDGLRQRARTARPAGDGLRHRAGQGHAHAARGQDRRDLPADRRRHGDPRRDRARARPGLLRAHLRRTPRGTPRPPRATSTTRPAWSGTRRPARRPVSRRRSRCTAGQRITFSGDTVRHTGTSGVELADQTQDSTVTGSSVTDTSGIGVAVGEVDDYYQTRPRADDERRHRVRQRGAVPRRRSTPTRSASGWGTPAGPALAQRRRLHAVLRHLAGLGLGLGVELRPPGRAGAARAVPARHHVRRAGTGSSATTCTASWAS